MHRRGFTLIELLVVIAVIAILAAILFPVFSRARAKARQASCLSNQKQIALALLMYADDYDEMLPPGWYEASPGVFISWDTHFVQPYIKSSNLLICPEAKQPAYGYPEVMGQGAYLGAFGSPSETVLLSDIKKCFDPGGAVFGPNHQLHAPSNFGSPPTKPANDADDQPIAGDATWVTRPRGLHNGGANVAYLDGHAKWSKTDAFFYGQTPTDRFFDTD